MNRHLTLFLVALAISTVERIAHEEKGESLVDNLTCALHTSLFSNMRGPSLTAHCTRDENAPTNVACSSVLAVLAVSCNSLLELG